MKITEECMEPVYDFILDEVFGEVKKKIKEQISLCIRDKIKVEIWDRTGAGVESQILFLIIHNFLFPV